MNGCDDFLATSGSDDRLARTVAVINGKGGVGKCIAGDELVHCPDTGLPMTVEHAVTSRIQQALAYTSANVLEPSDVAGWVDSGIRPVIRIELASGRSITATHHHQMLAPDGWRRADTLQVGETLAAVSRIPTPHHPASISDPEVDIVAATLATSRPCQPHATSGTADHTGWTGHALTARGARTAWAERAERPSPLGDTRLDGITADTCGSGLHTVGRRKGGRTGSPGLNPRAAGDPGQLMPPVAYQLPPGQLARFIATFWMSDGCVDPTGDVALILASEPLARAFQHLLLRFGVQSQVRCSQARYDGEVIAAWRLTVYASFLQRFYAYVPLWGRKAEQLQARVQQQMLTTTARLGDAGSPALTPELCKRLRAYADAPPGDRARPGPPPPATVDPLPGNTTEQAPRSGLLLTDSSGDRQRYLSRSALQTFLATAGSDGEFGHLVSPDLYWDRITAVVDAGTTHVYDLSVPGPANFIANDLVVHNTSITANVSGQLAAADYRVLAADLDLSGNLKLDLGYVGHPDDDDGKGLVEAIWSGVDIPIIKGVRENLDVIPGGRHLEMLGALSQSPAAQELAGGGVAQAFAGKLAALAEDYDVVLLDCAPGNPVLQDLALNATRYVLIPTKTDAAGWDGLRMVGPRVKKARRDNPKLTYLGVLLFAHQTNATRVLKSTQAHLEELGDRVPLFEAFIRHSETAAHDCRARGQLAHELARDATVSRQQRLALLRTRHRDNVIPLPAALSASADSLGGDYEQLTREILLRITAAEQAAPPTRASQ